MTTILLVLAGIAFVGYVLVSRMRGTALNMRRVLVVPAVLTVIGLVQLVGAAHRGFHTADLILVGAGVTLSAVLGMARGATVQVSRRNGQPWLHYRPATLALWGATVAVRIGLVVLAHASGATLAASGPAILLSAGATLLGEGLVVASRAFSPAGDRWQARVDAEM